MIYFIILSVIVIFYLGYKHGQYVTKKKRLAPIQRCHAYDGIIKDWIKKNQHIHKLETRIFRLKRANNNLRSENRNLLTGKE